MPGLPDPSLQPEFYALVPLKRLIAWVVDTALIILLVLLVTVTFLLLPVLILPLVVGVIGIAYRTVTIARWSATPGMLLMAIELRDAAGRRLDPGLAFLHTLGFTLASFFVIPQIVSMALMLLTARGQGLVDLILGTAMLNRPGAAA